MQDLEKSLTKFQKIVSHNFCNDLAKRTGFIKRSTSRIQGHEFAQAMMIPNGFLEAETLNSLGIRMHKINNSCNLSASALAQRINSVNAQEFMKGCFSKVLIEIIKKNCFELFDLENLLGFNRILIEDSTKAELHEKLSPHFQGTGGVASKASVKIDFIFDYLSEKFVHINFFSGVKADQSIASQIIPFLEKDDLVLRDLGYYALERFKEIELKGAYYISRFKSDVLVYESKEAKEPLDLAKFLDRHLFEGKVDMEVYIGKERHCVRLVASLMSEQAINKRRRGANRISRQCGRQLSKKKSRLLKFCIFITNIPFEILQSKAVMATYRARWRIEIIFKQWKSCLKLHMFKGYNKERFHCFLYGRLIMILLLTAIAPPLMEYARTLGRELSTHKLINYLIGDHAFPRAIQEGNINGFIEILVQDLPRRLCMEKRSRKTLRENIRLERSYYKELKIMELENVA